MYQYWYSINDNGVLKSDYTYLTRDEYIKVTGHTPEFMGAHRVA